MPHCLYAKSPEQLTRPIVVDSSIGHGPIHLEGITKGNIALRSYEWGKHPFGILLAGAFGDVANNHTDHNLVVLAGSAIPNEPSDIVMDVHAVYPSTE